MSDTVAQDQIMQDLLINAQGAYAKASDEQKFSAKRIPETLPDATYTGSITEVRRFVKKSVNELCVVAVIRLEDTDPNINGVEFEAYFQLNAKQIWKFKQFVRVMNYDESIDDITEAMDFALALDGTEPTVEVQIFTNDQGYKNERITNRV